jgi:hypothetical protein
MLLPWLFWGVYAKTFSSLGFLVRVARFVLDKAYQNGKIYHNDHKKPNGHKLYQTAINYTNWWLNIPTFSIPRPPKKYTQIGFLVLK